ncbi:MAG TPA: hypothetical protein VN841_18270 [Bryobacteraceae bacterium]|nr:hypothetical protein [Bryobacteraceae bacterium]
MQNVIKIPEELARELDLLAQAEHTRRTPYAVDLLWRDVRRNKQRQALKLSAGAWNPDHHPELARGGADYVEKIRSERDERFPDRRVPSRRVSDQSVDARRRNKTR